MCGIIGIIERESTDELKNYLISGMTYLQHRGQDSAGITLIDEFNKINTCKGLGLVSNVFSIESYDIQKKSKIGIGHVRYSTQGAINICETQPFYTNFPYGITLAHNGNIINNKELISYLNNQLRHINTNSDSELLLNVIANELKNINTSENMFDLDAIFVAIQNVMKFVKGSYSVVLGISGMGLLAFRDPYGIRPLCYGKSKTNGYMFASESVALTGSNYKFIRDIEPGECIFIDNDCVEHSKIIHQITKKPCLFEYIYFARPDSILDGISVYQSREVMGYHLGKKIISLIKDEKFDVVIPVPETSRTYAIRVAEVLKIPYRDAFVKNRYIARTFIMSNKNNNQNRSKMVKMKLNTIDSEFYNKNIIIVDDSIVRGTTSKELVKLAKDAGAKNVWFASASPPIRYANRYGIDIKTQEELIAYGNNEDNIANILGCERVIYNDIEIISESIKKIQSNTQNKINGFETSCFDGIELV